MAFTRSPQSHREQAGLLRKAGNERLAAQHELIAVAIERREAQESAWRELDRIREERQRARSMPRS